MILLHFKRLFCYVLLIAISITITGCNSAAILESPFEIKYQHTTTALPFVIDAKFIESNFFEEDIISIEDIDVIYSSGLQQQALLVAKHVENIISFLESELGLKKPPYKITIILLRTESIPSNLTGIIKKVDNLYFPLYVINGKEDFKTILLNNVAILSTLTHELAEVSMTWPGKDFPTLARDMKFLNLFEINNGTRWFRDGCADYASYRAYKKINAYRKHLGDLPVSNILGHTMTYPLFDLAALREKIFLWSQSNREIKYYSAAFGVFIYIESRFGDDAVRLIIEKLDKEEPVNGKVLAETMAKVLGVDLTNFENFKYSEFNGFKFGVIGVPVTPVMAKNKRLKVDRGLLVVHLVQGSGVKAGLRVGDVLQKINDETIVDMLDLQLAMLQAIEKNNVTFTVYRDGIKKVLSYFER